MSNVLFSPLKGLNEYNEAVAVLRRPASLSCVNGAGAQKAHLVAAFAAELGVSVLYVAANALKAKEVMADLSFFDENTMYYPPKDALFYASDAQSGDITRSRVAVMDRLSRGEIINVVAPVDALFDAVTRKSTFAAWTSEYKVGGVTSPDDMCNDLVAAGYERVANIEGKGQFAVRGGIVDVFPVTAETAFRVEFWGDEIDSIRSLDEYARRSVEKVESLRILPARDFMFDEGLRVGGLAEIAAQRDEAKARFKDSGGKEQAANIDESVGSALDKLSRKGAFIGAERFARIFCDGFPTLFHYFGKEALVVIDEPNRINEAAEATGEEYKQVMESRVSKGLALPSELSARLGIGDVKQLASHFRRVVLSQFPTQAISEYGVSKVVSFNVKPAVLDKTAVIENLTRFKRDGWAVVLLSGGTARGERLAAEFTAEGLNSAFYEGLNVKEWVGGLTYVTGGSLTGGFEYPSVKFALLTTDAAVEERKAKRKKRREKGERIAAFTDLRVGDYVVHDEHGVGIYKGIEKINVDGVEKDYLKVGYDGGGNLYVQTTQLDTLTKYIGAGDGKAKINKLGGAEWKAAKARVKGAVEIVAKDLARLYAERQSAVGHRFAADTVWQTEFEEMFPFEETGDQLAAIEDVKNDMESAKVMDRLICGDVGYGKTEIAVRAAFKAVQDGKQAAFLAPTTILAQQHYNTLRERFADYPVTVGLLSRLTTPKQTKETTDGLKSGSVDIVVGTHALLSDKIRFKRLGLMIVDEEQRFGVSHKEKLKRLRANVDAITLTATPIPRTLHMSLTGIRDMSVLEEPPNERRPVQTYVMEYSPEMIREAIHRELARDGQVYYLHNRVNNIADEAAKVAQLAPEARVAYAHGQMAARELEDVMLRFINREIDVLVCTTIVETGLDIPNVNTIVIQDADKMGLAQLYQLRGRVGRSNRAAYAYLTYRRDKVLTEESEKRLQTIREFTEFGSGFKIAMRDLEIRGAGNLLGAAQHGHMDAVGYDMYCKLLLEAVAELRKGAEDDLPDDLSLPARDFETEINVAVSAYLPDEYITDEGLKLEIYKKIAAIDSEADFSAVYEEMEDRFGDLPQAAVNLMNIAALKAAARNVGVTSVIQKDRVIIITFKRDASADPAKLAAEIKKRKGRLTFTAGANPHLAFRLSEEEKKDPNGRFVAEVMGVMRSIH